MHVKQINISRRKRSIKEDRKEMFIDIKKNGLKYRRKYHEKYNQDKE